ncbi:MlaD family protein [Hyphomonas johnsonii]|uniref:Virulence factor Mce-like protein n=1 Tax=Hyphomonas johnsonii MHS-2 TaxID=1280950 RepID=A0A059FQR8_9PROT|nr:MlaD family protein [Hyphomonas johnsonii]KCZ92876.1 virulence factor Mce-like protein [Hyphomonas johnsonii MHS-2]
METRANYALIGAFVLLAVVAIAGFVMWLGQSQFRQDFKTYDIVFDGPVSLEEGSQVRYIGIKVGEVSTVRIDRADPSKVRARIRIDRETPVRTDSTASIQLAGITGITFVQITAGTGQPLEARPGEPVPVIRAERTQLDQLFSGGAEVLGNANRAIERVNLLLTDENIAYFTTTLRNVETVSGKLARDDGLIDQASITLANVSDASVRLAAASSSFEHFSNSADARIAEFAEQINGLVGDVRGVTQSAHETIAQSTRAATAAADAIEGPATDVMEDARLVSQDLRVLINRLDRLTREFERNPKGFVVGDPIPYESK